MLFLPGTINHLSGTFSAIPTTYMRSLVECCMNEGAAITYSMSIFCDGKE